jgi:hypothetical protein
MDPERLLSAAGDGNELERELLTSIRDVSPPRRAKSQAWDGIATHVAAAAVVSAAGAHVAMSATAGAAVREVATVATPVVSGLFRALATKVVLGTVVAGSTVAAGASWVEHRHRQAVTNSAIERHVVPAAVQSPPVRVNSQATVGVPCGTAVDAPPCPKVPTNDAPPIRVARPDPGQARLLGIESEMLTEARAQLRSGDPHAALSTLDRLQLRSPKAVLGQEREVIAIQALSALGNTEIAKRRAKAFVAAYPNSPHTTQIRHIAEDP